MGKTRKRSAPEAGPRLAPEIRRAGKTAGAEPSTGPRLRSLSGLLLVNDALIRPQEQTAVLRRGVRIVPKPLPIPGGAGRAGQTDLLSGQIVEYQPLAAVQKAAAGEHIPAVLAKEIGHRFYGFSNKRKILLSFCAIIKNQQEKEGEARRSWAAAEGVFMGKPLAETSLSLRGQHCRPWGDGRRKEV